MTPKEKTTLELLLYDRGITITALTGIIGAKQTKTAGDKVHGKVDFKLGEMRAIKDAIAPDMTLDEIFEGYSVADEDEEDETENEV